MITKSRERETEKVASRREGSENEGGNDFSRENIIIIIINILEKK